MSIKATNYDQTQEYEVMETKDLSSSYFEKASNSTYKLKDIQEGWFADNSNIKNGALCSRGIYQPVGYNSLRVIVDLFTGGDKGIFVVACQFNQGGQAYSVFYWSKAGNGININGNLHLGPNPIAIRYAAIEGDNILFDLQNVSSYSVVGVWSATGIKELVPISV